MEEWLEKIKIKIRMLNMQEKSLKIASPCKPITEIITGDKPSLSFEVFPPKLESNYESVNAAIEKIAGLKPSYMSVTYGAGGGTSKHTVGIAANLKNNFEVTPLAHLTCVSSTREEVIKQLDALRGYGVTNVLALRGDLPEGFEAGSLDYKYASELINDIKDFGGFCIGGACYPEGHPESPTCADDIKYLKEKVDMGCEFLTTQMFFDNNILYNFMYRIREAGIKVPVIAGIMPVTNASQMKRIGGLSGAMLPQRFRRIVDRYGSNAAAMKQAGIAFATEQIIDLYANGINAVHVYSMNKPDVAQQIQNNLSEIIK